MARTHTAIDFLLEDLEQVLIYSSNFILAEKDEIESVYEELKFIRIFLKDAEGKFDEHEEFRTCVEVIGKIACEALDFFDSSTPTIIKLLRASIVSQFPCDHSLEQRNNIEGTSSAAYETHIEDPHHTYLSKHKKTKKQKKKMAQRMKAIQVFVSSSELRNFKGIISSIKEYLMELRTIELPIGGDTPSSEISPSRGSSSIDEEVILVGLDDQATEIKQRIVQGHRKLEVISIVGMGGIGKTTLARKVYNDPFNKYYFYVHGWTYVSQVYQKKDLLLRILCSLLSNEDGIESLTEERLIQCSLLSNEDSIESITEESLGEKLYRFLKGKRYLIVVDDLWNIKDWHDLRMYFPDDSKGSRILLTTRLKDVALQIKPGCSPHYLPFLAEEESWDLLQQKVFGNRSCPPELMWIGKQIAAKCQGLPLAVVVVGGHLKKKEKTQECWEEVAHGVSSFITGDADQFMDILALSLNQLPRHLQSCFLYFGKLAEDREIPVQKLILSWIAEGYVQQVGERSLEDIAEDYLLDLVDRSLVIASKKRSRNGVKTCRVHDMLRELCLRKSEDWKFLPKIDHDYQFPGDTLCSPLCFHSHNFHYMPGNPCFPHLCCHWVHFHYPKKITSYIYKLLRVFDLGSFCLRKFPYQILELIHLRYLAYRVYCDPHRIPPEISNLWNLETLIIMDRRGVLTTMPHTVWTMMKLRHLRCEGGCMKFEKPRVSLGQPHVLGSLQSISGIGLSQSRVDTEFLFERTPNLRKVVFDDVSYSEQNFSFPNVANLIYLDTLKISTSSWSKLSIPQPVLFLPNLKKLTLSYSAAEWKEMSKIGKLPNLEVLKLRENCFSGSSWETSDGEFLSLKYLQLSCMDLKRWITSSSHFPSLQKLVVEKCFSLEELPSSFGYIPTLQVIDISFSKISASNSALKIREEQLNMGNDELKVVVSTPTDGNVNSCTIM